VSFRRRRIGGASLRRGLILVMLLLAVGRMTVNATKGYRAATAVSPPWYVERAHLIEDLVRGGGQHLILVKYSPGHRGHDEWVYNSPELDRQAVIFARSMGDDADCRLSRHYAGRRIWTLNPDAADPGGRLRNPCSVLSQYFAILNSMRRNVGISIFL